MNSSDPSARDRLLHGLSGTLSPAAASDLGHPASPPSIPDHELIRRIGRGSYGEVWLARSVFGVWRAVKIIYRRSFDHDRPFERELEGILRFEPVSRSHPSQLNVLHVGRNVAAGCFYYVMELADDATDSPLTRPSDTLSPAGGEGGGEGAVAALNPAAYSPRTLRSELHRRSRLPCEECLDIGLALATALDHLHRHGLVHRDIKPSNIIFVGGIPKLADIGLVTAAEATLSVVGTQGYLPPEGPGTPQADIYSLGKVLYEMATGRDRQEYPELPTNLIEMPAPERAQIAELNEVIVKACHADPKQRYSTAAELHADLALLQSGKSVSRMRTTERRLRTVARAGALVTAVAALTAAGFFYQRQLTRQARKLAVDNRQLADNVQKLGEENRQRIVRLDIANGVRLLDEGDPAGALLWFADALPLLANHPAEETIHRIRIQQTLDQTPKVLCVFAHDAEVASGAFSSDGRWVATGTKDGGVRVWDVADGRLVWGPTPLETPVYYLRFSRDGRRLFASSSGEQAVFNGGLPGHMRAAILDAASGREWPPASAAWAGISTNVTCGHFSPDDRWLALAGKDGIIRVFATEDGRQIAELRGHTDSVGFISFSTDGGLLASASLDHTVRLWRLPSGEPVGQPLEHRWPVVRVLMTDDGRYLLAASVANPGGAGAGEGGESEVRAWDAWSGEQLGRPISAGGWISMFVAPGPQRRFFVDSRAYSFDSPGDPLFAIELDGIIHSWGFNGDGTQVAVGGGEYVGRIFSTEGGAPLSPPLRHGRFGIMATRFSPDEHRLLTVNDDGTARLWDTRQPPAESARRTLPAPIQQIPPEGYGSDEGLSRVPGHTPIFLEDFSLRLFGENLEELKRFQNPHPGTKYRGIASAWSANLWAMDRYDPDGKAVLLWRPDDDRVHVLEHPEEVFTHVFTRDDRFLVTMGRDGVVRYWRTADGQLERAVSVPQAATGAVRDLSPDGRTALWLRPQQVGFEVQFLDLESGELMGEANSFRYVIFAASFSNDGQYIAFLDSSGPVTVLESRTGRLISKSIAHTSNLIAVEWDPFGSRLLTAGHDDQVLIWDVVSGRQLFAPLRTPGGIIRMARWSPDGRFIITRSDDRTARVWDAATGEAVTPNLKHDGDVAFARMTGINRLITASYPDLLRAWDLTESTLPPEILVAYAQWLSGRRLTAAGTLLALRPEEWVELNQSLRTDAPELLK